MARRSSTVVRHDGRPRRFSAGILLLTSALAAPPVRADGPVLIAGGDLTVFSLEQLMDLEVTSVSKTPDKYFQAPAAIYVITGEDLRRSGVTSLPEALRLAPGMQVARIGSNQWAVGARGFASGLSRYTLVLIDGRSVYTPLFAGTYWDAQDVLMEDVDRIEVIRGPGGALWGANAVNGVINIITKKSGDTQGLLAAAGGGTEERLTGAVRYGGARGEARYRVYAKYLERDESFVPSGDGFDDWHGGSAGFRGDWSPAGGDALTLQGQASRGRAGTRRLNHTDVFPFTETATSDSDVSGGHLLGRWSRSGPDGAGASFQVYIDRTDRRESHLDQNTHTVDLELQQSVVLPAQQVTWGAGYRYISGHTDGPSTFHFQPAGLTQEMKNLFLQDQISIAPDRLTLTLGGKAEHNDYTGWESQPGVRVAWTPTENQTFWGSVSKAVRTPSRLDREPQIVFVSNPVTPAFVGVARYVPNPEFHAENLVAYEAGYRARPAGTLLFDLAGFFNRYDDIQSLNIAPALIEFDGPLTRLVLPFFFENRIRGRIYGGEWNAVWKPMPWWRVEGVYSFLRINLENKGGAGDGVTARDRENLVPRHQAVLRSSIDLPGGFEVDPMLRHVGHLRGASPAARVPAYTTADLRLGWSARDLDLSVTGQNLFQSRHPESAEGVTQIQRGVYGKVTWRWQP